MQNMRFAWSKKSEQDKRIIAQRICLGSKFVKYSDIEDQLDMAENFIEMLSKHQGVDKEDIIEGLYRRLSQKQTGQNEDTHQANGIRAAEKYKKKDDNTVNEVCRLLFHGNNYSEIARELHIDRRTVKKIAVKHGFTKE